MASKRKATHQRYRTVPFKRSLYPIPILVLLACVAYANSTDVPFVFDDLATIQMNWNVRSGYYSSFYLGLYLQTRSLLFATFDLNNWLGGQNVWGYHVLNVILHILNGVLVFLLGAKIFRKTGTDPEMAQTYALLAASFFVVHPIQTESVTYISSRSELLSTFFYLLGLLFFVMMPENRIGFLTSLIVSVFMALGFGAKETVITLPAAILLYDYLFVAKCKGSALLARLRFYASFVILAAAGSYYLLATQVTQFAETSQALPRWSYLLTQQRVIFRYIRLLVIPIGLNLDYDFATSISLLEPGVFLSVSLFIGLFFAAWKWRRTTPIFSFAVFWFFITLSPTSSVIPIPDVIFEHRVYLPLAGSCLAFPLAIQWLVKIWRQGSRKNWIVSTAGAVLGVLVLMTVLRNEVWRDEVRLWSDIIAKSPHKVRPYGALIYAYMQRGQDRQAISVAKLGSENVPEGRLSFLNTMGNLYLRLGQPEEAITYFKSDVDEAARSGMGSRYMAVAHNNLAVAHMALAKTFENRRGLVPDAEIARARAEALHNARDSLRKSLDANPENVEVVDSLVTVTRYLGEAKIFEQDLRKNLEVNARDFQSLYSLAALLSLEERYSESLNYFQSAEEIKPDSPILLFNHAFALSKIGEGDRAIAKYAEALQNDPIFNEAHYNIALLYIGKGDYDNATSHLSDILSRERSHVRANMKLAEIYAHLGKVPLARQHLRQVLAASPQDPQAVSLFQKIGGQ